MADTKPTINKTKGYAARFCVVSERSLATFNQRTPDQVIEAQSLAEEEMLATLELMVKSARAGKLEGKAALQVAAVAW